MILQEVQSERADRHLNNPEYWILWTDPPGGPIIMSGRTNVEQIDESSILDH